MSWETEDNLIKLIPLNLLNMLGNQQLWMRIILLEFIIFDR